MVSDHDYVVIIKDHLSGSSSILPTLWKMVPQTSPWKGARILMKSAQRATSMPVQLDQRIQELHEKRFKEFEEEVLRRKGLSDRAAKYEQVREKRRRELLANSGVDLKTLDSELKKDQRTQEKELEAFLGEFRPEAFSRASRQSADAKDLALRSIVVAEGGHVVLTPYATTFYSGDRALLKDVSGVSGNGAINSGWVFPDDPSKIRLTTSAHNPLWCFQAGAGPDDPVFSVHFAFVPASTANYEMTAIFAFHGFYVLRSDDSWYNCRHVEVKLTIQMHVNQYLDIGLKSFPALIDRNEDNVEEVTTYDRTGFFDYTTALKAGDPVIVTVSGTLRASARGGGAYAELNFESGTANYIEPLLLSVIRV
jgi:hypothetical protein